MELQFPTHVKMLSGKCYITPAADAKPSIYNPIKDYEKLDKNERSLYRQGMAAFGGVAPTYHIGLRERPPLVWDCEQVHTPLLFDSKTIWNKVPEYLSAFLSV